MAHIISIYNCKGGVSKTTTTFHLAWMLVEMGHRTLVVDGDPQCNLTGLVLNGGQMQLEELYNDYSNVHTILSPAIYGAPNPIEAANCYEVPQRPGMFLLPGSIHISQYEQNYTFANTITTMINIPGAFRHMLQLTADKYSIEYIIVDMSPSVTAWNANLFTQSDFFVLPLAPDFFSHMAISSLVEIIPEWNRSTKQLVENSEYSHAVYRMKETPPIYLGNIQQRFRSYVGKPTKGFGEWIRKIDHLVANELIPIFEKEGMLLEKKTNNYRKPLAEIGDFNTLVALAQENGLPVFALTQSTTNYVGNVWDQNAKKIKSFCSLYASLAQRLIDSVNTV